MDSIRKFYHDIIKVWANEIRLIFKDKGILIFLFLLPLAYPIVYALIYNPELAREVPVAVVDECRSTQSRELVRMMDASENTQLPDMPPTCRRPGAWLRKRKPTASC